MLLQLISGNLWNVYSICIDNTGVGYYNLPLLIRSNHKQLNVSCVVILKKLKEERKMQ